MKEKKRKVVVVELHVKSGIRRQGSEVVSH